jgi:hypothetical protein
VEFTSPTIGVSRLAFAAVLAAIALAVVAVLAVRAGSPPAGLQLWAVVVALSVVVGGLIVLSAGRAAYLAVTGHDLARQPAFESLRPLAPIVALVGIAILVEVFATSVFGCFVYGDRPGPGCYGPVAPTWQGLSFALWICLFVLPVLTVGLIVVISVEHVGLRLGLPLLAVRIAGASVIGAVTLLLVAAAGWYIALTDWAAVPIAAVAGIATLWFVPGRWSQTPRSSP